MSVISNNQLAGASGQGGSGYQIDRSLRFNADDTAYLSRDISSAGNRKTWTWSGWVKIASTRYQNLFANLLNNSGGLYAYLYSDGKLYINDYQLSAGANLASSEVFRDHSAWYHFVIAYDTTQSTAADRVKLYVNGTQQTLSGTFPNQNIDGQWNKTQTQYIGKQTNNVSSYTLDAYLAEVHFIDGQALAATDFGEFDTNNVWQPKEFTGSYGTHVAPTYDSTYGSDITSTEVAKTIDGNLSTYGVATGDFIGYTYSTSNEPFINIKWENTKSSNITVYIQPWVGGSAANSGTFDSSGGNSVTIAAGATLNTKFNFPSGYQGYFRVYTSGDGVYLRMYDTGGTTREFNSFHLDFSDNSSNAALGTDSSGNSNTWTVNNLTAGLTTITSPNRPTWNAGTDWTRTNSNYSADYSRSGNSYSGIQATLSGNTTYHFYLTFKDSSGSYGGWYFNTSSSSPSNTVPNELGGNTLGLRTGHTSAGAHGDYATANGVSAGQSALSLSALQSSGSTEHSIEFVINTTVGKVWARKLGDSSYVGGGDPTNSSSTPSFSIPTGAQYFGYMAYQETGTSADFATSAGNVSEIDSLIDTPTNYTAGSGNNGGNYATLNPLQNAGSDTFSDGNLKVVTNTSNYGTHTSTIATPLSGKWYAEVEIGSASSYSTVGLVATDSVFTTTSWPASLNGVCYYGNNGNKYIDSSTSSYGASFGNGDVIGIAYDADNGTVIFYKNGVSQGTISSVTVREYFFGASDYATSAGVTYYWNFGQRPFAYTPPTGYVSLCTTNLPEPTIEDGSTAFDVVLYSGTGSSQTVGSLNFSPDLAWMKQRSGTRDHMIHDTVRGDNNPLYPSQNYAEHSTSGVTFGSTGFTLGTDAHVNQSSNTYAAWTWDAGSSNTSISVGSLNSSVYDQSQTWTNQVSGTEDSTYPFSNVFNADNMATHAYPANGTEAVFTPNPSFSSATTVKIWYYAPTLHANAFKLNGTGVGNSLSTTAGTNTHTFDVTGTGFTSLSWSRGVYGSEATGLLRIDVDGVQLVDAINDSQTWSNSLTGLSGSSLTNPPNAFDTDESSYADSTAGFTLDLSGHTFGTGAHTIEVKSGGATSFTVNGSTSLTDPGGGGAKVWTGTHTGELTSLASSATGASVYYIKIDDKYLANPGQNFVTNVPSIATTYRANPSSGISICSYTGNGTAGATVGHNLNSKPDMILFKSRGDTQNWMVYHSALGATKAVFLSTSDSANTNSIYFNNTEPTSSVFSLGTRAGINQNSDPMIAYCFAPVEGFSAFGSYQGNSSADGTFVYTGMRPRWLMVKSSSHSGEHWLILDTERDTHNVADATVYANLTNAEAEAGVLGIDILSNGFKCRGTNAGINATGYTYVYAAFAEHPFKTSRAS